MICLLCYEFDKEAVISLIKRQKRSRRNEEKVRQRKSAL